MKNCLLSMLLLLAMNCFAQFSKTHYIPPLSSSDNIMPEEQYLYISTPQTVPVNFRITNIGGSSIDGTVSRDIPYIHLVGFGPGTQLNVQQSNVSTIMSDKGFIIEADDLIYVSARIIAGDGNHAGEIVSKGLAALGTEFRIGGLLNTDILPYQQIHYTFVSILATENNTLVSFDDIRPGAMLINDGASLNNPSDIILNSGESFVMAVAGPLDANRDALIGSLVTSNKPIAVVCGSFGGTNGEMNNIDLGFDQIVSAERTGKEYIFIRSTGLNLVERVLLIAHEDATQVFVNGQSEAVAIMNAGQYMTFNGSAFGPNGNLYITTSKNVFAYQSVGDNSRPDQANQEMFFVPPLSCETPRMIDNIPDVDKIGNRTFDGRITLITETGAGIEFLIDGINYPLSDLAATITVDGPNDVPGNPDYQTYIITGLTGDVSVYSTGQLYLASYGSSNAATFGGFYSGFTFKPEISFDRLDPEQDNCIPNVSLSVSPLTAFDVFQWYFNDSAVAGANSRNFIPMQPGYYQVSATISACGTTLISDKIPVSSCPDDLDGDGVNNNVDIDNDNDGISNCTESHGNLPFDLSDPLSGIFTAPEYINSFSGNFPLGVGEPAENPFIGSAQGNFTSEVTAGKGHSVSYKMEFENPITVSLEYAELAEPGAWLTSSSEFIISVPVDKTISVLNPNNQILIDTNYDGIYESGITEFSSFEIRFRLNNPDPLPAGDGTFSFRAYLAETFTYTHKNLIDDSASRASFKIAAACVPKDTDGDNIIDQLDADSDNDGIPDFYESQGIDYESASGTDVNSDGMDDVFSGFPADTDNDGVMDYVDLDSDNDGIYDLVESSSNATDADNNGIVDGLANSFGVNGLTNSLETFADSGIINYTMRDSDEDLVFDHVESDSDGDDCTDVREAGFSDFNKDGFLGDATPSVDFMGVILNSGGYTDPNPAYQNAAPIIILMQPQNVGECESGPAVFSVETNPGVTYQWQIMAGEAGFVDLSDSTVYSGTATAALSISSVSASMNGSQFRVLMERPGNICGKISQTATLAAFALPAIAEHSIIQCDTGSNPDGITLFNLQEAAELMIGSETNLSLTFHLSAVDAEMNTDPLPSHYTNLANPQQVIARITDNSTGCHSFVPLNLQVNLLPNIIVDRTVQCDDDGTEDGHFVFDLSAGIPGSGARYFLNETDALLEQNAISNPQSFLNQQPYELQTIIARVENGNDCARLYNINIKVLPLPYIDTNPTLEPHMVCVNSTSFTTVIDAGLLGNADASLYDYQWFFEGNPIAGSASTLTVDSEGTYSVIVSDDFGCSKTRIIPVIASSTALIENIEIEELSANNTVTVTLTATSYGNYVYSLDYQNAFQQSNIFSNVMPGIHTVFVKDLDGCPVASQVISVLGIPPYFTPNGDGFNDTWNVKGVSSVFHSGTIVYIFDRYGKLIREIGAAGAGWDGTFNGRPLPSTDYWFVIKFEDGTTTKGHFALKR